MQVLEIPAPISPKRISLLESRGIDRRIAKIDLEMVKMKLRESKEGIDWTNEQVEAAEIEYKRYLTLCLRYPYPAHSVVPNKIMDTMWHYHILDTRAYISRTATMFLAIIFIISHTLGCVGRRMPRTSSRHSNKPNDFTNQCLASASTMQWPETAGMTVQIVAGTLARAAATAETMTTDFSV